MDYILLELAKRERPISLKDINIPFRIKQKPLLAPGIWNGYYISPDLIKKVYERTDWNKKECRYLYLDHNDRSVGDWVGEVDPETLTFDEKTGMLVGDLLIVDLNTAIKLAYGAKFGISPSLSVIHDNHVIKDFDIRNFAIVVQPAMTTNYINNSLNNGGDNMENENKILELIEDLAKKIDSLRTDFEKLKAEYESEFEVSPEEMVELAKLPPFSEFYKKFKEKYPDATMEDAAKAWKKEKKKKERYPYPEEYPYPENIKNAKNEESNDSKNQADFSDENANKEKEAEPQEKPVNANTNNDTTQYDYKNEIETLRERVKELELFIQRNEKPVVNEISSTENVPEKYVVDPKELFYNYIKGIGGM